MTSHVPTIAVRRNAYRWQELMAEPLVLQKKRKELPSHGRIPCGLGRRSHRIARLMKTSLRSKRGPEFAAGIAAGQADGADHRTLAEGVVEVETLLDEAVERWRLDLRIAERMNGVPALIIGEDEEDVGADGEFGDGDGRGLKFGHERGGKRKKKQFHGVHGQCCELWGPLNTNLATGSTSA